MPRTDPLRNFRFRLEIDQITQGFFSEVAIGESTTEPIDYREGTEPTHVRKLPGLTKYGNITLKWGVTDSMELYNWHKLVVAGKIQEQRKKVKIIVIDEAGADKASYVVTDAWPTKYDPSDLNGKGNEVFIEVLELANEGIERTR
ncbi:phage tail protein [Bradyrhizobium sp. 2S1]|uniref:phage tail protein n=1 Tax=Bradyrhizobium sp. 2S1 TaxID=1404429 RepID=UPI00140A9D04|nr:phage tail protein [Bradyrhizobium sp. 2S1]MCK7665043.1 phage tail protein [Bradyrhizobium sp. 2S1]